MLAATSALLALLVASTTSMSLSHPPHTHQRDRLLHVELHASPDCPTGLRAIDGASSQCVRLLDAPDLDQDGRGDVLLSYPATCDDAGTCEVLAAVRGEGAWFSIVLPRTRVWDLTAGAPHTGTWLELHEARPAERAGESVGVSRWRCDGDHYAAVPGSYRILVDEP